VQQSTGEHNILEQCFVLADQLEVLGTDGPDTALDEIFDLYHELTLPIHPPSTSSPVPSTASSTALSTSSSTASPENLQLQDRESWSLRDVQSGDLKTRNLIVKLVDTNPTKCFNVAISRGSKIYGSTQSLPRKAKQDIVYNYSSNSDKSSDSDSSYIPD